MKLSPKSLEINLGKTVNRRDMSDVRILQHRDAVTTAAEHFQGVESNKK
jgi:hypothetical protein